MPPATTALYTLSLHDALPISVAVEDYSDMFRHLAPFDLLIQILLVGLVDPCDKYLNQRSEEHTSELQSHHDLVCRLLLEKKKNPPAENPTPTARVHRRTLNYA